MVVLIPSQRDELPRSAPAEMDKYQGKKVIMRILLQTKRIGNNRNSINVSS